MNEVQKFIDYVGRFDLNLEITNGKYLYGDGRCLGYFDSDTCTIRVAGGKSIKKWLPVLVHEFSHYQQFIEKDPTFFTEPINGEDCCHIFFNWLSKKRDYDQETIDWAVQKIILVEKNCEIRSVKNIKKFNLPIDIDNYIREANRYLYQHYVAKDYRRWIIDISEKRKSIITQQMPTHFKNKHHLCIPEDIYKIIEKGYGYTSN